MRIRAIAAGLAAALLAVPAAAGAAEPPANYQGDTAHTGSVEAAVGPPLGKRWARPDLGRPDAPILYDGRVFVTAVSGESSRATTSLHALDAATGATLWSVPGVAGRVSAAGGLVLARAGRQIVARDAASGAVRWSQEVGEGSAGPVADDELVYVADDGITAFRTPDGLRIWHAPGSGTATSAPAVGGDQAYAVGCGAVFAAERRTGVRTWAVDGGGCASELTPVSAAGRVWTGDAVRRPLDGATIGAWSGGMPAVAGDRTVVGDGSALRAQDLDGRRLWEATLPGRSEYADDDAFGQPLIAGRTVYTTASGGLVVGHDLATGREVWRSSTRVAGTYSTPGPGAGLAARGERLVVAFPDKLVGYGPGADSPGVDPDPWRDPAAVKLSLAKPADPSLLFGQRTALRLSYQRVVGSEEGGLDLMLQADPFPFGTWTDVRRITAEEAEYDGVTVRPDRNTRYRVRYGGVIPAKLSEDVAVRVDVRLRVRYRSLSPTRLRARITLRAPADRLTRKRLAVPFYYFTKRTNRSRRIGVERLRRTGANVARGQIVLRVPRRWARRDYVYPCLPEKRDDGFGRFEPGQRLCGRKRF